MKKVCFVTAARSEYGLLKWLMKAVNDSPNFELQILVTGAHLLKSQGHTIDQIIADGFDIIKIVDAALDVNSPSSIAKSVGRMTEGIAEAFDCLKPDYVLVLGDRYELLAVCSAALIMRIPIIHLSGGDVTEGAIDDGVRNAVTMLADYHFPETNEAKDNIIRMRNRTDHIWQVGNLGLDAFYKETLLSREQLAESLKLSCDTKWILFTYHSETKKDLKYNLETVSICLEELLRIPGVQIVATYANADFGGVQINDILEENAKENQEKLKVIPSLGTTRYLSLMREVCLVIGNSSSGICEAPLLKIPVINVGNRQKGRYQCGNIIQCDAERANIHEALDEIIENRADLQYEDRYYWGDGNSCSKIVEILSKL